MVPVRSEHVARRPRQRLRLQPGEVACQKPNGASRPAGWLPLKVRRVYLVWGLPFLSIDWAAHGKGGI